MAKAKKEAVSEVPSYLATIVAAAQKTSKIGLAYLPGLHAKQYWGIPIPWLSLQWLMGGINILAYGQSMEIAGPPGALKSTLLLELMWAAAEAKHFGLLIEAEDKTSPTLMPIVLQKYADNGQIYFYTNVFTLDDWQIVTTSAVDKAKAEDPTSKYGMIIGVDSVSGKATEEEQEKFEKEGMAAGRGFSTAAGALTKFYRSFPATLIRGKEPCWPFVFIGVNHLKKGMDEAQHTPGGVGKDFKASARIWSRLEKVDSLSSGTITEYMPPHLRHVELDNSDGVRRTIRLKCQKSSYGENGRLLELNQFSAYVKDSPQQVMWFDWDGALATLLLNFNAAPGFKTFTITESSKRFMIEVNGAKAFPKQVTANVAGRFIMDTPELRLEATNALRIFQVHEHRGGQPMKEVFSD